MELKESSPVGSFTLQHEHLVKVRRWWDQLSHSFSMNVAKDNRSFHEHEKPKPVGQNNPLAKKLEVSHTFPSEAGRQANSSNSSYNFGNSDSFFTEKVNCSNYFQQHDATEAQDSFSHPSLSTHFESAPKSSRVKNKCFSMKRSKNIRSGATNNAHTAAPLRHKQSFLSLSTERSTTNQPKKSVPLPVTSPWQVNKPRKKKLKTNASCKSLVNPFSCTEDSLTFTKDGLTFQEGDQEVLNNALSQQEAVDEAFQTQRLRADVLDRMKVTEYQNVDVLFTLIEELHENNVELFDRALHRVGPQICLDILKETKKIEENGGMRGTFGQKRQPGGVFLFLLKQRISKEDIRFIWDEQSRQQRQRKRQRNTISRRIITK